MNRFLGWAAFGVGLSVVAWVGHGYLGSGALALTMTGLIAAFYLMGGLELWRFQQATSRLDAALAGLPRDAPDLGAWLGRIPASLRNPVRLRIEGERTGLPGPAMTPYLLGLLVLLGMLGTFLGMVVTLNGAVLALESTTDLPTIRAALAAPVKGLGLAFGTSVAGVAASAMLGLVSALCRRERLQASQRLDTCAATSLRVFSRAHQRQTTLETLQAQARAVPELLTQMQAAMSLMQRQHAELNERLLASQERFHGHAQAAYTDLAASVGRSLTHSLTESARAAATLLQPLAEATMSGMAREAATFQAGITQTFHHARAAWAQGFEQQSASLLATLDRAHAARLTELAADERQRLAEWAEALRAISSSLQHEWRQAGEHTLDQQERICRALEQTAADLQAGASAQGREMMGELSRLVETASQAPRAAAEIVGLMREKLSDSLARDNVLLEERQHLMVTLRTLLEDAGRVTLAQQAAIDGLVSGSADLLGRTGAQFGERIEKEASRMEAASLQIAGGAVEVSSLGEAFGLAVQMFSTSNEALLAQLQRIEGALNKSTTRSDEQLAYYVAQARELIDLSLSSQQRIVQDLQGLAAQRPALAGEVA